MVTFELLLDQPFDLVLLDLSLPDSQGLTTFETLYQRRPDLPIIVLTGLMTKSLRSERSVVVHKIIW